jgi:hypothetical protein
VTFVATEHFGVHVVAKDNRTHRTLDGNIHCSLVATTTIAFDTERGISIMAGSARLTVFHLLHTHLIAVGIGLEGRWVTFVAFEHGRVFIMTKEHRADIFGLHGHVNRIIMTSSAVATDTESRLAVMTGPAGLTIFHLLHTHLIAVRSGFE